MEAQDGVQHSTLELYRHALRLRRDLQGPEDLAWADAGSRALHFVRPGGWHSVTNFCPEMLPGPAGTVLLSSGPVGEGTLPPETTVWTLNPDTPASEPTSF